MIKLKTPLARGPARELEKLAGPEACRIRSGSDDRAIDEIDDDARPLLVVRIRHRLEVYRRL
ncbi:MAG: type II toxin-antitoxin system RelE/ParE family toxin [Chloroflexota bacterium]|nr:type II toxin-antitoxin system RelE/ParE family toxin [Chloroflexota bacterium]